ncbi:MAG TPA: hypothetical protein VGQ84_12600 [Gaiellaceae bacterium]|jgi:hypothetical protein|nr:hypothetical protein [Gaiellaceae bacterium]
MHGFKRHLIFAVALACGVAALTASALAAPPNPPPGQEKKAEQAPAPAPAATPAPQPAAPTDKAKAGAPGQQKKAAEPAKAGKPAKGVNAGTAGVKPSNTTHNNPKWTTVGAQPDVSKRYGNGKTAAQIARSRGAPGSTPLYGPGNSQPHKVCGKNGHYVDVHAVKSYPSSNCAQSTAPMATQQTVTVTCPPTTTLLTTGVHHRTGSGKKIVVIHPSANSAHVRKHGDRPVTVEATLASGATCSATIPATTSTVATQATTQQIAAAVRQATGSTVVSTAVVPQGRPASGSVLGAEHTASRTGGAGSTGGVAGAFATFGKVAAGTLPFTGFPLWAAVVIALAAIAVGWTLWRRGRPATTRDVV